MDAALLERERYLTRQLNAKATRQLELGANSPQLAPLKQEISQLENEFEMVRAAIRKDNPHYDALVQPSRSRWRRSNNNWTMTRCCSNTSWAMSEAGSGRSPTGR